MRADNSHLEQLLLVRCRHMAVFLQHAVSLVPHIQCTPLRRLLHLSRKNTKNTQCRQLLDHSGSHHSCCLSHCHNVTVLLRQGHGVVGP
jgi:hypothetical protein